MVPLVCPADWSKQAVHPLVARININDANAAYGIMKWHLTHLWTKIVKQFQYTRYHTVFIYYSAQIIIRSAIHTVPAVFYRAAKELGVKIELDV